MNSSKIRFAALLAALFILIDLGCHGVTVSSGVKVQEQMRSAGIFGRMLDEVTKPERLEKERHKATLRKKQQLAQAEQEYQQIVQEDEMTQDKSKRAKVQEDQQIPRQPQAQSKLLLSAATGEESQINIGELESNIQANLQAKIDAGASKADLLASIGQEDVSAGEQSITGGLSQSIIQNEPQQQKTLVQTNGQVGSQETSKEKVKQIAKKLDIPFTNDLLALGSNAAISDALIEQAMANGKTDAEINEAMETL